MPPSRFVRFIEQACNGALDAAASDAAAGKTDAGLAALGKAVGRVLEPLRALFDARRGVRSGGWDDADLERAASLVRRVKDVRPMLDDAGPSEKRRSAADRGRKASRRTGSRRDGSGRRSERPSGGSKPLTCRSWCSARRLKSCAGRRRRVPRRPPPRSNGCSCSPRCLGAGGRRSVPRSSPRCASSTTRTRAGTGSRSASAASWGVRALRRAAWTLEGTSASTAGTAGTAAARCGASSCAACGGRRGTGALLRRAVRLR